MPLLLLNMKTFSVTNTPSVSAFEIDPTEFGNSALPVGEYSAANSFVRTRVSAISRNANHVVDSNIALSGSDINIVPRYIFNVANNRNEEQIFSVNTSIDYMESIAMKARDNIVGASNSRNVLNGEITRITQRIHF